jgi:hypothetical protein
MNQHVDFPDCIRSSRRTVRFRGIHDDTPGKRPVAEEEPFFPRRSFQSEVIPGVLHHR